MKANFYSKIDLLAAGESLKSGGIVVNELLEPIRRSLQVRGNDETIDLKTLIMNIAGAQVSCVGINLDYSL